MLTRGSFTPSSFLAPNAPIQVLTINQFSEYLRLINNSPYQLTVNMDGNIVNITDFRVKDILLNGLVHSVTITPSLNISSGPHSQSNLLIVEEYGRGEIVAPVDNSIPQQAVTATASGKPIFSATVGFGATTTRQQNLNIFNPANSGAVYTMHAARVYTNDSTGPTANLAVSSGADIGLTTPVPAVSHSSIATPPVSTAHCTASDDTTPNFTVTPEVMNMQQGVTQDFLTFPDEVKVYPGNNVIIELSAAASGHVVRMTMKWTEDLIVPPVLVLGATAVASSIINQGNPIGTSIITAASLGDAGTAILMDNVGDLTLGDASFAGQLKVVGASSPAIDLSNASIIQGIKFAVGSLTRIQFILNQTVAVAGTVITHGLGVTPSFVIGFQNGGSSNDVVFTINETTMTSTQFTAYVSIATTTACFLVVKL